MEKSTFRRIAQRVALRKLAKDECSGIKDIHKYVKCRAEKLKEDGAEEGAAFGTAWGIACKHKRDELEGADESCQKPAGGYLKGQGKKKASTWSKGKGIRGLKTPCGDYIEIGSNTAFVVDDGRGDSGKIYLYAGKELYFEGENYDESFKDYAKLLSFLNKNKFEYVGMEGIRQGKKKASADLSRFFNRGEYLYNFFSEKKIREQMYEKEDKYGVAHLISTEVVVEFISKTSGSERKKIEQTLRMIDFKNGRVEHFIEHLANAIANLYGTSW